MHWTTEDPQVPFVGNEFKAFVRGSAVPSTCVPVVYNGDSRCGLGVSYSTCDVKECLVWGPFMPRKLITAWRAAMILQHLTRINNFTLAHCFYAASRNPWDTDRKYADEVIALIGRNTHEQIMSLPIPDELIRYIIDHQSDDLPPSLCEINEEVAAGTLNWRESFSYLGVKPYHAVPSEIARRDAAIARFDDLLSNLARYRKYPRHCPGMDRVEDRLFDLLEQGIDQTDKVIVALAFLESEFEWDSQKAAKDAVNWLNQVTVGRMLGFLRPHQPLKNDLLALRDQYFPEPPKITFAA